MWPTTALNWVLLLGVCLQFQIQAQVGLFREGFTDALLRGSVRQYGVSWGYNPVYADYQSTQSQNLNSHICSYIRAGFATEAKLQSISVECSLDKIDPISFDVTTKLRMTNTQLIAAQLSTRFGGLNEILERMLDEFNLNEHNFTYDAHVLVVGFLHGYFDFKRVTLQAVYEAWNNESLPLYTQMNDDICAAVRSIANRDAQFSQIKFDCEIVRGGVAEAFEASTKISILATELKRIGSACDPTTVSLLLQNKIAYRTITTMSVFYKPLVNDPDLKSEIYYYLLHGQITQRGIPLAFRSIYEAKRSEELRMFLDKVGLIIKQNLCIGWSMAPNFVCKAELQSYNMSNMMFTTIVKMHPPYFSLFGMTLFAEKLHIALTDMIQTGRFSNENFTYNAQVTNPDIMFITINFQLQGILTQRFGTRNPETMSTEICLIVKNQTEMHQMIEPHVFRCSLIQFDSVTLEMQMKLTVSVGQKGYRYMLSNTPLIPSALNNLGARGRFTDSHTGYRYNAQVIFPEIHTDISMPTHPINVLEENTIIIYSGEVDDYTGNLDNDSELFLHVKETHCNKLIEQAEESGVPSDALIKCEVIQLDPVSREVESRLIISNSILMGNGLVPEMISID